ncbi:hypothetical protein [Natrialba sp. PRR66]|uniref:hypothetical protein n=1 Tax=Natrialba sp. PRR66 TaxID=3098146 RepID=UPI002B1D277B|nr:hypothetical protein [Natrialba sp. PRR66]
MTAEFDDPAGGSISCDSHTQDPTDLDAHNETVCYRCDRPIETDRWIRLTARPGPGVTGIYEATSRPCCPDCAAALGLLEFTVDPRSANSN